MILDYNRIDPELLPFLESFPALDISHENVAKIREMLAEQDAPPANVEVSSSLRTIETDDGSLDIHVFRKNDRPGQAALLWVHGGGYILGSADDERAKIIADHCDCTVFSVDYRLAPEHPFPAGPNDCHAALCWLFAGADDLGIDKQHTRPKPTARAA